MLALAVTTASAQRMSCIRPIEKAGTRAFALPDPPRFDPQKTYRQPVILVTFSDADFMAEDPAKYYDRLFNEKGFNEGSGPGCVADYFRDQSAGRLNLQFDIYGPFKLDLKAGGRPKSDYEQYYGQDVIKSAIKQLSETEKTDFSVYDWDGNGLVNQVLFVVASYCGNQKSGYIYPNTGSYTQSARLPGNISPSSISITCERWGDGELCGIGTIIHEFCHCLGLPDIYPLRPATAFSTVDEWDMMDGGNYTNRGWCPPNLSAMEKMYLGWRQPVELKTANTVTGMKSVSDGGETYMIRSSGNQDEFYLLENRQQKGWDYASPGNGLLIFHVDYNQVAWGNGQVNVDDNHYRYDLFHADCKTYRDWDPKNDGKDMTKYTMDHWMRNRYLSTSPYPYTDPETLVINASLTDDSTPASTLFSANAEGVKFMQKAITNIRMADDGTISFDFMKETTGINRIPALFEDNGVWFDLQGRRLQGKPTRKGVYIHNGKKVAM